VQIARGVLLHDEPPRRSGGKRTRLAIRAERLGRPARIALGAVVLQVSQRALQASGFTRAARRAASRSSVGVPTPDCVAALISRALVKPRASLVDFSHGRVRLFRAKRTLPRL
jgi:hypothetical protein